MTLIREKTSDVCSVFLAAFCILAQVRFASAFDNLTSSECQRRTGQPCLTVVYGPYTGVFVFDTGSDCSFAYGAARFQESPDPAWHFKETHGSFSVGAGSAIVIENIRIRAFNEDGERTRLVLLEKPQRSPGLSGIDGILGMPSMLAHCVGIQRQNQEVTKLASPWQPHDRATKATLKRQAGRRFVVPVTFALQAETLLAVDTGCRGPFLLRPEVLKFQQRLGNAVRANKVVVSTASEIREVQTYILKSVTLCGFEFRDIPAAESNFNVIGMGCLSHFDMVLDFPYNNMWLTPHSNDWPKRVPPDASGLVLGFQDTNLLTLVRIQPDSAASKSELQVDDQILLFDGKEPKDLSMREIHQRQTQAGTILPLRVRRGDQEFDVQRHLGYSFEYPPQWPTKKNVLDEFGEFLEKDAQTPASEHAVPNN